MTLVGGDIVGAVLTDPHPVLEPVDVGLRLPLRGVTAQLQLANKIKTFKRYPLNTVYSV